MIHEMSVFNQQFDVVVYGSGYAAVAAALELALAGKQTLLLGRSMDVLWESGRAFAGLAGESDAPAWRAFVSGLEQRGLYRDGLLDCVAAEVSFCERLREGVPGLRVLLGASLVSAAPLADGRIGAVTVATKLGERVLRAGAWVDASDEAALLQMAGALLPEAAAAPLQQDGAGRIATRKPTAWQQRAVLLGAGVEAATLQQEITLGEETTVAEGATAAEGATVARGALSQGAPVTAAGGVALEPRLWDAELTLCFASPGPLTLDALHARAVQVRDQLPAGAASAAIVQLGEIAMPVFENVDNAAGEGETFTWKNCVAATPLCSGGRVVTLAERFSLGLAAAKAVLALGQAVGERIEAGSLIEATDTLSMPLEQIDCEVLVAGGGSSGALAALAAAEAGAQVVVVDTAPTAGGVATGGLITGYFHGQPGGLFEAVDACAAEVSARLDPARVMSLGGRHQDGKKIAFEQCFTASGKGRFLGGALVYKVDVEDGRAVRVYAAGADRLYLLRCKTLIDATGDGDLCALAGAGFEYGRVGDGLPLGYSQPGLRTDLNKDGLTVRGTNFDAGWVDSTDPEDLTRARIVGIAQYGTGRWEQDAHPLQMAPVLGVRQSRHIHTEEQIGLDDMISHSRFENSVGSVRSPMDTHSVDYEFEDDEALFWLWGCKNFRGLVYSQLPYGALIPKGLRNVWIACRASGVSVSAAYAARMVRDVQRMGEAAGYAAAAAARLGCDALAVPMQQWRSALEQSGALALCEAKDDWQEQPLEQLDGGKPGGFLWTLYKGRALYQQEVFKRMDSADPHVSWLAALVLCMWGDERAQPRLLRAIREREEGLPTPRSALGAHGQWIDVPNWFLAISLLRMCGTAEALPVLLELAKERSAVLNFRTSLGLTLERLGQRLAGQAEPAAEASAGDGQSGATEPERASRQIASQILDELSAEPLPQMQLRPSRSFYRSLRGEEQQPLRQEPEGVDTREDHGWQLWLTLWRASEVWGLASPVDIAPFLCDERALVRKAFAGRGAGQGE